MGVYRSCQRPRSGDGGEGGRKKREIGREKKNEGALKVKRYIIESISTENKGRMSQMMAMDVDCSLVLGLVLDTQSFFTDSGFRTGLTLDSWSRPVETQQTL